MNAHISEIRQRLTRATNGRLTPGAAEKFSSRDVAALLDEIDRLNGALTNARAVAADRIADRDRICHDLIRERDQARADERRQIAEDIRAYKDNCRGADLAFYAGMNQAASVVRNDIKAGA